MTSASTTWNRKPGTITSAISPVPAAATPPAREIHVFEALIAAFEEARTRGIRSVAVQPLGTSHAGLDPERFLKLLAQVCYSSAELTTTVRRVHLLLPSPAELNRYEALLQTLADKRGRVDRKA